MAKREKERASDRDNEKQRSRGGKKKKVSFTRCAARRRPFRPRPRFPPSSSPRPSY